jgi:hypothetical protein
LNGYGALHRIDNTDELGQQIVAGRIQYFAAMLLDECRKHFTVRC